MRYTIWQYMTPFPRIPETIHLQPRRETFGQFCDFVPGEHMLGGIPWFGLGAEEQNQILWSIWSILSRNHGQYFGCLVGIPLWSRRETLDSFYDYVSGIHNMWRGRPSRQFQEMKSFSRILATIHLWTRREIFGRLCDFLSGIYITIRVRSSIDSKNSWDNISKISARNCGPILWSCIRNI